jgi:hypothetical protein
MTNFEFETKREMEKALEAAKAANPANSTAAQEDLHETLSNLNNLSGPPAWRSQDEIDLLSAEYQRVGRLRIECDWAGPVWLIVSEKSVHGDEDGSVYFPGEIPFLVDLSPDERRLVDGFKRCFGGTIDVKPWDETR